MKATLIQGTTIDSGIIYVQCASGPMFNKVTVADAISTQEKTERR
jgi:hypothetical protein